MAAEGARVVCAFITLLVCVVLLVTSAAAQDTSGTPPARSVPEITKSLAACMGPLEVTDSHQGVRITVRLGFNAGGQPLGPPRFTYVASNVPDQIKSEYKDAVVDALHRCTPLSFSPELGRSIAGVPLILVFDETGLRRVQAAESSAYIAPVPVPSSQIAPAVPVPPLPQQSTIQPPPIWVPGLANPVPSLPHGPETSQDRRSRCTYQSGLYRVPLTNYSQYMGLCTQ